MRRVGWLMAASVAGVSIVSGQIPAGAQIGLARYLQGGYRGSALSLQEAAQKMPEADYGFKPSTMAEARTFAAVIAHAADGMFAECAVARGVSRPTVSIEKGEATKAKVVQGLTDAIEFCDPAFAALTEASASEFVRKGAGDLARSAVLAGLLAHNAEMFGISTVYLRAKNLVPPGSR